MNARLIGFDLATPPRNFAADRADYIRDQAMERAQGPYAADEVSFSLNRASECDRLPLMAAALNSKDDAELGRLIRLELEKHRYDFHESELEMECDK